MKRLPILLEFVEFLKENKRWWISPIVIILMLLGAILVFAKSSVLAPFIYTLF
jgi:hypothetical protein